MRASAHTFKAAAHIFSGTEGCRVEHRGPGGPTITLTGRRSAVIDGCDGVEEYGEERVRFRAGRLNVQIEGRGLRIIRLTESAAVVEGGIASVQFLV